MLGRGLKAMVLAGLFVAAWGVVQPAWADRTVYVVQAGDALSTLARRFDVTVAQLREWNELDGDVIRIGQELIVYPGRGDNGASGEWRTYTIVPGDTLSEIAARFDVGVSDLVSWNEGLDPDRIRAGDELRVRGYGRPVREITYEVGPGDFVSRIARRYHCTVADIVSWNDGLDPDSVTIGQELTLYIEGPEEESLSVGRAHEGQLVNGEQLPPHRGYVIRDMDRAWGTNETITFLLEGFDAVREEDRHTPRVEVHDLSLQEGGEIGDHNSHESGRDADIGYYQVDCDGTCEYQRIDPEELDSQHTWSLISHWIENGQIEYIFMDYSLQEPLYEYAQSQGVTERELDEWFQYPHGRRAARGLIRHWSNHRDHFHVRFACPEDDEDCR
jgi:LysM repeat protein